MSVEKNIASYIKISGETTNVAYHGQQQTCRHCAEIAHNGISCVQNKKLMLQKTYADAAKQSQKPATKAGPRSLTPSMSTRSVPPSDTTNFPELTPAQTPEDLRTQNGKQHKSYEHMPPPSGSQILKSTRLQTRTALQLSSGEKPTNGDDTDTSTTSVSSKRGKGNQLHRKKLRTEGNETDPREEEMEL